jgi:3-oxoacyl-[acyl-carrier protein] reductase
MGSIFNLEGKIAFVTGSTRGIGWASAQMLAQQGATIVLNGLSSPDLLRQRVDEIRAIHDTDADGLLGDVGNPAAIKEFYAAIFKKYKRLDILVNNAGIMEDNLLGMIGLQNIEKTFRVNVTGVILNMQYATRLMERSQSGSIINLSSIIGRFGNAGQIVYAGSKAAVIGVTLSAAKELAVKNIRVNAIAPGFIDTDMVRQLPLNRYDETLQRIKMNRIGTAEDIAKAVLFFASDLSLYVTGQILGVDGGMLI